MSPSWIERARGWVAPRVSAGLTIGREYVGIAELAREEHSWNVRQLVETRLEVPLFKGQPTPETSVALAGALEKVAVCLQNRYVPVHVSLPDAVVRLAVFELEELPEKRSAQVELARWRLAQDSSPGASEVCACQPLGQDGAKQLLLALAMDKAWYECVTAALSGVGIVAWSISSNACRQFNRFHDRIAARGDALVTVTPDTWALWLWDSTGRLRYARARWHSAGDNHAAVVSEIERSILAYVHGAPDRSVAQVFVAAGDAQSAFISALNSRLHEPSMRLSIDDGLAFEETVNRGAVSAASSLAAALER